MSREDLEELRAEYAAMSRKDWNAVFSLAHRDFELRTPGGGLDVETIRGVKSARRAFEDFFSPFEALSVEPEAFFDGDGRIAGHSLRKQGVEAQALEAASA
jgi:ketosteroid isomerase-like protein